ncbi:hypothetical protein B0H19DRAFT_1371016 [Mycena capillaripes]|nr:hypothetical protein B0H19DRAFT_1371016 [Mycena capillaripes]
MPTTSIHSMPRRCARQPPSPRAYTLYPPPIYRAVFLLSSPSIIFSAPTNEEINSVPHPSHPLAVPHSKTNSSSTPPCSGAAHTTPAAGLGRLLAFSTPLHQQHHSAPFE